MLKGDGEQRARLPLTPLHQPPTVPGKAGGLAQSSTQGWGGGRHMGAAGAAPAAPAHPAGGARRDRDIPMMCFLEWLFFFFFPFLFFFSPFLLELPCPRLLAAASYLDPPPALCEGQPGIISITPELGGGGRHPSARASLQSRAPRAASVELDFIHQAECLQPGKEQGGSCRLCQERWAGGRRKPRDVGFEKGAGTGNRPHGAHGLCQNHPGPPWLPARALGPVSPVALEKGGG